MGTPSSQAVRFNRQPTELSEQREEQRAKREQVYYKQLRSGHMEVWLDTQTIRDEAYYRNVSWNNTTWALRVQAYDIV